VNGVVSIPEVPTADNIADILSDCNWVGVRVSSYSAY
jgi:hypothetical protein